MNKTRAALGALALSALAVLGLAARADAHQAHVEVSSECGSYTLTITSLNTFVGADVWLYGDATGVADPTAVKVGHLAAPTAAAPHPAVAYTFHRSAGHYTGGVILKYDDGHQPSSDPYAANVTGPCTTSTTAATTTSTTVKPTTTTRATVPPSPPTTACAEPGSAEPPRNCPVTTTTHASTTAPPASTIVTEPGNPIHPTTSTTAKGQITEADTTTTSAATPVSVLDTTVTSVATVTGSTAAPADTSGTPVIDDTPVAVTRPDGLPRTGATGTGQLLLGGLILVLVGAGLILVARRRPARSAAA